MSAKSADQVVLLFVSVQRTVGGGFATHTPDGWGFWATSSVDYGWLFRAVLLPDLEVYRLLGEEKVFVGGEKRVAVGGHEVRDERVN